MKQIRIPIFVPHLGCPQQCSFCNQRTITGTPPMTPDLARRQIESHLATVRQPSNTEIAFFGGSFTAIERTDMEALLQVASPYLASGAVSSIRISTRPDAIDEQILSILAHYGVGRIELGIQSTADHVLLACNRGHTTADSYRAAELILRHGFTLGGQMMVGLPRSTSADEEATARAIVQMGAREARIYPVVVFPDTPLAEDTKAGRYRPLTVEEAIDRSVSPLEILLEAKITLLRIGLCETEVLHTADSVLGGAYHPALGELCYSALYQKRIFALMRSIPKHQNLIVSVAPGRLSMAIGQKRCNRIAIEEEFAPKSLRFAEDPTLTGFAVRVESLS